MTGHFELFDNAETRFSVGCENMIESTNTNAKTRIEVSWIAPKQPDSGCVLIKAGVVQHRDVWFIDDGFLTKRICPEEIDELNSHTPALQTCCACDEAKYEVEWLTFCLLAALAHFPLFIDCAGTQVDAEYARETLSCRGLAHPHR